MLQRGQRPGSGGHPTDQGLGFIKQTYGIDFRRSLAQIITDNTDIEADASNQVIAGWALRWQGAQVQSLVADTGINILQSGPNGRDVLATDVGINRILVPGRPSTRRSPPPGTTSRTPGRSTSL